MKEPKYTAKVHINPDSDSVQYVGTVTSDTLKDLKDRARLVCAYVSPICFVKKTIHLEINGEREIYIRK